MRRVVAALNLLGAGILTLGAMMAISAIPDAYRHREVEPEDFFLLSSLSLLALLISVACVMNWLVLARRSIQPGHRLVVATNVLCLGIVVALLVLGIAADFMTGNIRSPEYVTLTVPLLILLLGLWHVLRDPKERIAGP